MKVLSHWYSPIKNTNGDAAIAEIAEPAEKDPLEQSNFSRISKISNSNLSDCEKNYYKQYFLKNGYEKTVEEWIYKNPLTGYEITHCAYCNKAFAFKAGGYMSGSGVYCCYFSDNNDHLTLYLQLRLKEAEDLFKSKLKCSIKL